MLASQFQGGEKEVRREVYKLHVALKMGFFLLIGSDTRSKEVILGYQELRDEELFLQKAPLVSASVEFEAWQNLQILNQSSPLL